jgi:transcriptional regulator with XRE-family HTH domain
MRGYRKNEVLIRAREQTGLKVTQAAKEMGIAYPMYSAFENGRYYPGIKMQERICDFYRLKGIPIDEEDAFPEGLEAVALPMRIPKNESAALEITYHPFQDIRYLSDRIPAGTPPYFDMEAEAMRNESAAKLREAFSCLTPRQQKVLKRRFGMDGKGGREGQSLEKVAKSRGFQITKEAIRLQQNKAEWRIMRYFRGHKLDYFI